jgi:hypothetical protein
MRRRELQWKARITSFVRQNLSAKINFLLGQRDYLTSTTQTKSQKSFKNLWTFELDVKTIFGMLNDG